MDTRKLMRDSLKGCDRAEVARFLKMSLGSLNNQVAGELPYRPKGTSNNLLNKTSLIFATDKPETLLSLKNLPKNSVILSFPIRRLTPPI